MSREDALATTRRVLTQLRRDPRTIAMLLVVPMVLLWLLDLVFDGQPGTFDRIGPALLALFPFVVMFLVTSVTTLRADVGHARTPALDAAREARPAARLLLAFGLVAVVQALLASGLMLWLLDLDVAGPAWLLVLVAVVDAVLGCALGCS